MKTITYALFFLASIAKADLFDSDLKWTDENNRPFQLTNLKDKNIIATMLYTECTKICPRQTTQNLLEIKKKLDLKKIDADFVIITLDPDRDHPDILKKYKEEKELNFSNWHFIVGNKSDTRKASEFLGLSDYWAVDDHIVHGYKITIFGADHKIKYLFDDKTPVPAEINL